MFFLTGSQGENMKDNAIGAIVLLLESFSVFLAHIFPPLYWHMSSPSKFSPQFFALLCICCGHGNFNYTYQFQEDLYEISVSQMYLFPDYNHLALGTYWISLPCQSPKWMYLEIKSPGSKVWYHHLLTVSLWGNKSLKTLASSSIKYG